MCNKFFKNTPNYIRNYISDIPIYNYLNIMLLLLLDPKSTEKQQVICNKILLPVCYILLLTN
jgi:hypothetical protein